MREAQEGNELGESGVNPFINIRLLSICLSSPGDFQKRACPGRRNQEGKGRKKGEPLTGNRRPRLSLQPKRLNPPNHDCRSEARSAMMRVIRQLFE